MELTDLIMCVAAFLFVCFTNQALSQHKITVNRDPCGEILFVSRERWGARDPVDPANLTRARLDQVFVHHTDMSDCTTPQQCGLEVRTIQNLHMDGRGWGDIGYSFLIGEDGAVYEGRGWHRVGAHTYSYNRVAYGIAILGNFMYRRPLPKALVTLRNLIDCGITEGHIASNYSLYGHRDTGQGTLCPGDVLYDIIKQWPNFYTSHPHH